MNKLLKEYSNVYGEISKDYYTRILSLIDELKINNKILSNVRSQIIKILGIQKRQLDFIFYLVPYATPRARAGKRGVFYVKDAKNHRVIFEEFYEDSKDLSVIVTPCKLYMELFSPTPSSMSKAEKILAELKLIRNISDPDWDNAGKTYSDMIQSRLLIDDRIIVDSHVKKYYSIKPRIEIHIEYMEEFDCNYNRNKVHKWKKLHQLEDEEYEQTINKYFR